MYGKLRQPTLDPEAGRKHLESFEDLLGTFRNLPDTPEKLRETPGSFDRRTMNEWFSITQRFLATRVLVGFIHNVFAHYSFIVRSSELSGLSGSFPEVSGSFSRTSENLSEVSGNFSGLSFRLPGPGGGTVKKA